LIRFTIDGVFEYDDHIFEPMKVGESFLITIQMENLYSHNVTLDEAFSDDPELKINNFTPILAPMQKGQIVFEFSPSKERTEPCDCNWGFNRIVIG